MPACEGNVALVVHLVGVLVVEGRVSLLESSGTSLGLGCLLGGGTSWAWLDYGVGVYLPELVSLVAALERGLPCLLEMVKDWLWTSVMVYRSSENLVDPLSKVPLVRARRTVSPSWRL